MRAEEAQTWLAAILESTDDGIIGLTLEGIITKWSSGAETIYGYSAGEVLGKSISILIPAERPEELRQILRTLRCGERVAHFDTVRVRKDGKRIDVSITFSPIRDVDGEIIGAATVERDITEQRRTNQALRENAQRHRDTAKMATELIVSEKRAEERLRESEERYRRIVETANEGIWVIDESSTTTFVNRKVSEMLGYREDEVIGRSIFDFMSGEEVSVGQANLGSLLQGESVQTDFKSHHKDGTELWLLVSANPLFDKEGRHAGALGMITDITERKRAEEAATRYTERLNLLRQVEQGILRAESPEAIAEVVLDYLQKLVPVERASIALLDYETREVYEIATYSNGVRVPGTREPFAAFGNAMENLEVTRRGETFVMDTLAYATESAVIRAAFEAGVRHVVNVPLLARGELIGCLCLGTSAPDSIPAEALDIAQEMAGPLAIAIQQARLFDAERQRSAQLSRSNTLITALGRVAVRLQASLDPQQVMETLGAELRGLEVNTVLALADAEERELLVRYVSFDTKALERIEGIAGQAIESFQIPRERVPVYDQLLNQKAPLYVPDVIPLAIATLSHLPGPIIESAIEIVGLVPGSRAILLPLMIEDRVLGFLGVIGRDLQAADVPAFSVLVSQVAVALENARLFEELRLAQGLLETLSHKLVEAQETERRTLARELHDEIGQLLTGLKLSLEMCMGVAGDGMKARLGEATALSAELLARVRELSLDLRPAMLDDLGLIPALLWQFEQFTKRTNVRVGFEHSGLEGRVDPKIETATYRIIQEALTNVARHAGAGEATVQLWTNEHIVCVQIDDRGRGFDVKRALTDGTSGGLIGMRQRMTALGGHLAVESRPGIGTRVTAELPLERADGISDRGSK